MRLKSFLSLLLSTALLTGMTAVPAQAAVLGPPPAQVAQDEDPIIYTSAFGSNTASLGSGTADDPFNLFEDALDRVPDGGTICIQGKAFLNTQDEAGLVPYVIGKNVTIRSADPNWPAVLNLRCSGLVLGGDVTFENITLGFANKIHDGIFANGHTLTLENVYRSGGSREVDLFAGQLYVTDPGHLPEAERDGASSVQVANVPVYPVADHQMGTAGEIILKTTPDWKVPAYTTHHLGNVYAGSMNGPWEGSALIRVENSTTGLQGYIGSIYSSGALEADPGGMFDLEEPAPPEAKSALTVSGGVTLDLRALPLRSSGGAPMVIDGDTGIGKKADVTISVPSPTGNMLLQNIGTLTLRSGCIFPSAITGPLTTVSIDPDAELDLSRLPDPLPEEDLPLMLEIGTLSGSGILTMDEREVLTVTDDFTGNLRFQTAGAFHGRSGPLARDHSYVIVPDQAQGSFSFTPSTAQENWAFRKQEDNAWCAVPGEDSPLPPLLHLDFAAEQASQAVTQGYLNEKDGQFNKTLSFPLAVEFDEPGAFAFLSDYHTITCSINGSDFVAPSLVDPEDPDSCVYSYQFPEMGLSLFFSDENDLVLQTALDPEQWTYAPLPIRENGQPHQIMLQYPGRDGKTRSTSAAWLRVVPDPEPQQSASLIAVTAADTAALDGTLAITAAIAATPQDRAAGLSDTAGEAGTAALSVNGFTRPEWTVPAAAQLDFGALDVTAENSFRAGANQLTVFYSGGTLAGQALTAGSGSAVVTVSVTPPTPVVSGIPTAPLSKIYDGLPLVLAPALSASLEGETLDSPQFTIAYRNSSAGEDVPFTDQAPTAPGSYQTRITLEAGEGYGNVTQSGPALTIAKADTSLSLSAALTDGQIQLTATAAGPEHGVIPDGSVNQGQSRQPLHFGTAVFTLPRPDEETAYSFTYTPAPDSPYNSCEASITVDFKPDHVALTGLTLDRRSLELKAEETRKLAPVFAPDNASSKTLHWVSDEPAVASVDQDGTVTAQTPGQTFIRAQAQEGGHIASCLVTVTAKPETPPVGPETDPEPETGTEPGGDKEPTPGGGSSGGGSSEGGSSGGGSSGGSSSGGGSSGGGSSGGGSSGGDSSSGGSSSGGSSHHRDDDDDDDRPARPAQTIVHKETHTDRDTGVKTVTETRRDGTLVVTETTPGGRKTVTETRTDGSILTTEDAKNGDRTVTRQAPDGSSKTECQLANGTTASAHTDVRGRTEATVQLSREAVDSAVRAGQPLTLPLPPVKPGRDPAAAPLVEIELPRSGDGIPMVTIPAESLTPGTVAMLIRDDGSLEVIHKSILSQSGISLPLPGDAALLLVDNSRPFRDMDSHWARDAVDFVSSRELLNGTGPDRFTPDAPATRGMLAQVLYNLEGSPALDLTGSFSDVDSGKWYAHSVEWAARMGIVQGVTAHEFAPEVPLTREQLAAMLYRFSGSPALSGTDRTLPFHDGSSVSHWAQDAMVWAVRSGLLNGMGDGSLAPGGPATRAQLSAILARYLTI